jgi:hypothetical protein
MLLRKSLSSCITLKGDSKSSSEVVQSISNSRNLTMKDVVHSFNALSSAVGEHILTVLYYLKLMMLTSKHLSL